MTANLGVVRKNVLRTMALNKLIADNLFWTMIWIMFVLEMEYDNGLWLRTMILIRILKLVPYDMDYDKLLWLRTMIWFMILYWLLHNVKYDQDVLYISGSG
jgi:hypothetical protein